LTGGSLLGIGLTRQADAKYMERFTHVNSIAHRGETIAPLLTFSYPDFMLKPLNKRRANKEATK